jgi:AraC family transcriptional regulator
MPLAPLADSTTLGWERLSVYHFRNPERFQLHMPPANAHLVVAHLRNPTEMNARWNGRWARSRTVPGRLMIVPAHHATSWDWKGQIEELQIFLPTDVLQHAAEELGQPGASLLDGIGIEDAQIWGIARDLQQELGHAQIGTRLFADAAAQRLALALLRGHSTIGAGRTGPVPALPRFRLQRACDFIETHLGEDISLQQIAGAAGFSESHFARAFKAATGLTPHRFLVQRRLQRAQELLRDHQRSLAEIALLIGFASQSHFSAAFRAAFGQTPKAWRDRCD